MTGTIYDLAVIGGGSAGLTAARFGVALGARTLLIDRGPEALGGECLHTGCVPSKALIHAARAHWEAGRTGEYGLPRRGAAEPVDLGRVMDAVREVIRQAGEVDTPAALGALGIGLRFGPARFRSPDVLEVGGEPVRARRYIVATGSEPSVPAIPGLVDVPHYTNDTIFGLRELPRALLVLSGGPIGCELGQSFARLGARVTIIGRPPRLLPREDPDAAALLQRVLEREGVEVATGATARRVRREGAEIVVTAERDGREEDCRGTALLVALGRRVDVADLELGAAGVEVGDDGVVVDEWARTANPAIFACGDVIGQLRFTHAAGYQAAVAVRNALLPAPAMTKLDYRAIPWATFTAPELARIGLTEEEARRRHPGAATARFPYRHVDRALTAREGTEGFIKVVHDGRGRILGAHIIGPGAGETINEVAIAMKHGLDLGDLAGAIHVYPTLGMGLQQAALGWRATSPAAGRARRFLRPFFRWQRRRTLRQGGEGREARGARAGGAV